MQNIEIKKIDDTHYQVSIDGRISSTHIVTILPDYAKKLIGTQASNNAANHEKLLIKSFEFLLARELNTSILRSFELSVIGRYFPEYEASIKTYFP